MLGGWVGGRAGGCVGACADLCCTRQRFPPQICWSLSRPSSARCLCRAPAPVNSLQALGSPSQAEFEGEVDPTPGVPGSALQAPRSNPSLGDRHLQPTRANQGRISFFNVPQAGTYDYFPLFFAAIVGPSLPRSALFGK